MNGIKIGQVWVSRDKRDGGKTVVVTFVEGAEDGFVWHKFAITTRSRKSGFLKRYALVRDVP